MAPLRVAVLGGGFIGQAHILALRQMPEVTVDLLVDHDPDNARRKAAFWGIPRASHRWEDAVADPSIDVIHNCLPNQDHYAVLKACIEAGKPLFTEKPLTRTADEARSLAAFWAARASRPLIGVNFNYRYYPMVQRFRAAIQEGAVGTPLMALGQYLQDWMAGDPGRNWRLDPARGGPSRALWDIGSHVLDLTEYVLQDRVARVQAVAGRRAAGRPPLGQLDDDFTLVLFETERGVLGSAQVSQVNPGHKNDLRLEIAGTEASLAWRQERPEVLWRGEPGEDNAVQSRTIPGDFRSGSRLPYPAGHVVGWGDALRLSCEAFYHDLRGEAGAEPRRVTLEAGLHSMILLDAVLKSAQEGEWVPVEDEAP
jgi:predicted dehydrogenase